MSAIQHWADSLNAWRIPDSVRPPGSPWVLPRRCFVRRADAQRTHPRGATHQAGLVALAEPGTVLDIGAGAGATSLALAATGQVTHLTALDPDEELLDAFAARAEQVGVPHTRIHGTWPEAADQIEPADAVLLGNVLYNVTDLAGFVAAATAHACRTVIAEIAERHPLTELRPLWERFHGITYPDGPTHEDCVAALRELEVDPVVVPWQRPPEAEHDSFADLVEVTRKRLCLPESSAAEVERALHDLGVDPELPPDLGSSGRNLITLIWNGSAES